MRASDLLRNGDLVCCANSRGRIGKAVSRLDALIKSVNGNRRKRLLDIADLDNEVCEAFSKPYEVISYYDSPGRISHPAAYRRKGWSGVPVSTMVEVMFVPGRYLVFRVGTISALGRETGSVPWPLSVGGEVVPARFHTQEHRDNLRSIDEKCYRGVVIVPIR